MPFILKPLTITPVVVDIKEFTDQVTTTVPDHLVEGIGIFDDLMETATKHVIAQFEAGRIRGEGYADAYIAVYQSTLQAALQIWLQKGLAEKQIEADLAKAERQLEVQLEINAREIESAEKQNTERIQSQEKIAADQIAADKEKTERQLEMQWRIALLQNEIEEAKLALQEKISDKQLAMQEKLADKQIASQEKQHDHQLEMQWRIALLNNDLEERKLDVQLQIAEKQLELLEKQAEAEDAKKELYRRQIKGFDEDFKQKLLKICLDSWAVGFSVARDAFKTDAGGGIPAPMQSGTITEFFNKLVYTELEKYDWKDGKHPDFENKVRLYPTLTKQVNVEAHDT